MRRTAEESGPRPLPGYVIDGGWIAAKIDGDGVRVGGVLAGSAAPAAASRAVQRRVAAVEREVVEVQPRARRVAAGARQR